MSRKLVIPGVTFTGPRFRNDEQQRDGTLMLIEPAHPLFPWVAGVPANGAAVPNVAADTAAALLGVTEANTRATVASGSLAGAIVERTSRGGLHVAIPRPNSSEGFFGLRMPTAIRTYLRTNPTHVYRHSLWMRATRAPEAPQPATLFVGRDDGNLTHTYFYSSSLRPDNANRLGVFNESRPAVADGVAIQSVAARGFYTGTDLNVTPANDDEFRADLTWGFRMPTNDGNGGPWGHDGWALYRYELEDLTVSGITFADALALDKTALATALGTGGRYNGDTYTAP